MLASQKVCSIFQPLTQLPNPHASFSPFAAHTLAGSRGHEHTDAKTFASWGVDYLKVDNCFAASEDVVERYTAMRDALNATGRPIV